jgi:hypothetical protein
MMPQRRGGFFALGPTLGIRRRHSCCHKRRVASELRKCVFPIIKQRFVALHGGNSSAFIFDNVLIFSFSLICL